MKDVGRPAGDAEGEGEGEGEGHVDGIASVTGCRLRQVKEKAQVKTATAPTRTFLRRQRSDDIPMAVRSSVRIGVR